MAKKEGDKKQPWKHTGAGECACGLSIPHSHPTGDLGKVETEGEPTGTPAQRAAKTKKAKREAGKASREEALELASAMFQDDGAFFAETVSNAGKKKEGRPTVMTPDVVRKLEQAFSIGCSDREACLFADISTAALYDFCNLNEDFSERKEMLKETPTLYARLNVVRGIVAHGNRDDSWAYLTRKRKAEFSELKPGGLEDAKKPVTAAQLEAINRGAFVVEDEDEDE